MTFPTPGVLISHAVVLRRTGKRRQAIALLGRGIAHYPEHTALRLSRALLARRLGDDEGALADALAAAELPLDANVRRKLLRLLMDLKRPLAAESILPTAPTDSDDLWAAAEVMHTIGAPEEKWRFTLAAALAAPADHVRIARNARSILRSDDPAAAARLATIGLSAHPSHPGLLGLRAQALTAMSEPEAVSAASAWEAATADDPTVALDVSLVWRQLGDIERARARLHAATGAAPDSEAIWAELAELALWSLSLEEARSALERAGDGTTALRVRGALALLSGDAHGALTLLDAALERAPRDGVAWTWRSEALVEAGRNQEALAAANAGIKHSGRFNLPALLSQGIAIQAMSPNQRIGRGPSVELLPLLAPIFGDGLELTPETLKEARRRLGGNRTPEVTLLTAEGPRRYTHPEDPRSSARLNQMVFKIRGRAAALESMDALVARLDGHQLVHTYRGELELWFGSLDGAVIDFNASLTRDPSTRWAKIGLGAVELLSGDPAACADRLERSDPAQRGPTAWIYLGEARRRLGQLDAAEETLGMALHTSRGRLSTWMNLALVAAARGEEGPALEVAAWIDAQVGDMLPAGSPIDRLEAGLTRMRGNRSSSMITWFDDRDRLRYVTWAPPAETPEWAAKAMRLASAS